MCLYHILLLVLDYYRLGKGEKKKKHVIWIISSLIPFGPTIPLESPKPVRHGILSDLFAEAAV